MEFDRGGALGATGPDGALVALAHVAIEGDAAELGISVTQPHRERGLAGALAAAALRLAQDAGAREFRFHYASSNEGMRRLAVKLGMDVNADGSDLVAQRALHASSEVRPVVQARTERATLAD
jgi:RimJ/RimL family protein N-acetyltransferase